MKKFPAILVFGTLAVLIFLAPAVSAAEDPPPPLAEMWLATPKEGHGDEFFEALEAHMAFRKEHGDPRSWQVYTPLLGEDLDRVAIRFCCFEWADQDAYSLWNDENENVGEHFNENVAPHAAHWAHYLEQVGWKNSHWVEDGDPYRFYAVTEFNLWPGHGADFDAARDKMSQIALNQGWATDDRAWLWTTTIGGGPQEGIVIPYRNYAEMDRDEDSFFRFLAKHMGDDAAADLLKQFSSAAKSSNYQIWEHQEKYSMSHDD